MRLKLLMLHFKFEIIDEDNFAMQLTEEENKEENN